MKNSCNILDILSQADLDDLMAEIRKKETEDIVAVVAKALYDSGIMLVDEWIL